MLRSDNIFWAKTVVPNLREEYLFMYMELLGMFNESCRVSSAKPSFKPQNGELWVFPFFDMNETDEFDHGAFENWCTEVEIDMVEKYDLPLDSFLN